MKKNDSEINNNNDDDDNDNDSEEEADGEDEDFPDNEEAEFDDDTDFPDEDESGDENEFPDEDTGNDDVDFPEETTEDEDGETEDTEDDDPFSGWGNDFDEDEDNDDFSPMDSSDDVEDPDYNSSDSKASKNFLDIVKSKAKECADERKEKVIPINKGKSIDESWRKTSEVGDIDDLWSFDSMKDLSGDEFDNMLYGESELDKRCENCSDVEVPDVEAISKTREARKRIGNSKRGVDAVEIKEDTSKIEVDDDEEDIFGSLNFEDEEEENSEDAEVDKDVTDEEDDDDIFGSLDFSEEDIDEDEAITKEVERGIKDKGYNIGDSYQKGSKQSVTSNIANKKEPKPVEKEVKVEEKKEVSRGDYKTLRDFVKANKGCTVSEALVLFSKKEIEKDLKMGRVYQRRDKLFI